MTLPTLSKHQSPMDNKNESDKGSTSEGGNLKRTLTTVTLTPEQFEKLYLQPKEARRSYPLAGAVGNPTPLYASHGVDKLYVI
jgi:hypothetical protein